MSDLSKYIEGLSPEKRALFEALLEEKKQSGKSSARPQAIPRRTSGGPAALSFAQQRLWFFDQLEPGSLAYNIPLAVRLSGPLDVLALEQSLNEIVRRHDTLRTTFALADGQPVQIVAPALTLEVPLVDLSGLAPEEQEPEVRRQAAELNGQPYDLQRGPLLRARLLRLAQGARAEHVLLLNMHHIVSDGWSLGLLVQEMGALYASLAQGRTPALPDLPIQYADFAAWQREHLQGELLEQKLAYWRRQLRPEGTRSLPVLELPTDYPRPAVQSFHGARERVALSRELTEQLKALSRGAGVTFFVTVLAAFQALLGRYTGQTDLIIGTPIAGRTRSELEGLIGFFVNSLALRVDLSGNPTFSELLRRVREVVLDADANQDLPFERLVEALQPERSLSHNPLFQVMFVLQNDPLAVQNLAELTLTPLEVEAGTAKLDLALELYDRAEGLSGWLEYNTDLFEAATIRRMVGHYQTLLAGIVANPDTRLGDLPLLSAEEHAQLAAWNATDAPFPQDVSIHELIAAQAARTPEAIAVAHAEARLSYRELDERANRLARALQGLGVGPDTLVGLLVERSPELLVGILGILKAGGAYLPLDPSYPADRLQFMLDDAGVAVLLTQERLVPRLAERGAATTILRLDADWPRIAEHSAAPVPSAATPDHLAYVIYTSGSTGQPKGVLVTQRNLVHSTAARIERYREPVARFLLLSSFAFDSSVAGIFWTLCQGGTLVLPEQGFEQNLPQLTAVIDQHAISHLLCLPSLYALLLNGSRRPQLSSLSAVIVAGEACPTTLVTLHAARLPNATLYNEYGPTEGTVWSTVYECGPDAPRGSVPIGRPIPNMQVYLLDAYGRQTPIGVPGELYIGGAGLTRGYLNRPDLTAERFIPDNFGLGIADFGLGDDSESIPNPTSKIQNGARLYKTGDLARWLPDGQIEFLGRVDMQVKIRGYRIEPGEIEAALREHPAVREAAVLVREPRPGDKRLVGYVTGIGDQGSGVGEQVAELRSFLKERLPEYMVPAQIVALEALPLTPNGKLDRNALPDPEGQHAEQREYVAPRSEIERTIAEVWQAALGVERVGVRDNFFDLGGHSLLLVEVHSKLRERLGVELTMIDLFKYPTIAALTDLLSRQTERETAQQQGLERGAARTRARSAATTEIAIVAMALRFPGANSPEQFWDNLRDGVETISFYSDQEVLEAGIDPALLDNPNYVKAEAAVEDVDLFDAAFFGYNPREAERMDPQHRFFLECCWEALERAGYNPETYAGRVGVYGGSNMSSYLLHNMAGDYDILEVMGNYHLRSLIMIGNAKDFMCQRVSYHLKLSGPSVNIQTACSTSMVAIHSACQDLLSRECDMALAGGVQIRVPQNMGYVYLEGGVPSPDGHCRPFDINSKGTVHANGSGVVVLKRLEDALADGDQIYAVIKGSAVNNDGAQKVGFAAPSVDGQAAAIAEAIAVAGIDPATIGYVEAHGTATELGDPIEVAALTQAFGIQQREHCGIGSVKSNLGHLDQASGVAGLIKTALALKHEQIPPTIHFTAPNPQIDFANSPFYVVGALTDWPRGDEPRRAGVSSFGIGGTNAHVVVEEAPAPAPSDPAKPWQLLVLSAKTATALETMTDNLAAHLAAQPELNLADAAYTLEVGRVPFSHRRIVVARDVADAAAALAARDPQRVLSGFQEAAGRPVAFMFPGQGAQYPDMGRELYEAEPVFRETVDRCARLLEAHLGLDLREVLYGGADDAAAQLEQTALTQPALFVIEYALAQLLLSWGIAPTALVGHSIGEYVAATLAGVFAEADALQLVATRGRLMQALPGGAMLSVPLPEAEITPMLGSELSLAAINGAASCVVAGPEAAIAALHERLSAQGLDCRRLHTSHAFHSPMMDAILGEFAAQVRQVERHAPQIPFISNVSGDWITADEATDPGYWARHLRQPVRFADGLQTLLADGERVLLEVGPGQTLSALARRHPAKTDEQLILATQRRADERRPDRAVLLQAVGRCWLASVAVNWLGLHRGERRLRLLLPTYPFERQRFWIEPPAKRGKRAEPQRSTGAGKRADIADWFYVPYWKPAPLPPASELTPATRWLVFADHSPLSLELVERLAAQGHAVTVVEAGEAFEQSEPERYTIDPRARADYERLIGALRAAERLPAQIAHLWSVGPAHGGSDGFEAAQERGFYSLLHLAQALAAEPLPHPIRISTISSGIHSLGGAEVAPEQATLLGACRVIPQEVPGLVCRSIDVALPQGAQRARRLAEQLLHELTGAASEPVVAYRGGQRWVEAFEPVRLPSPAHSPLREGGVYLITGGLGRIGLALAEYLATAAQARLALLGRTPLPPRAEWPQWLSAHGPQDATSLKIAGIQALEGRGAEVLVLSADVADPAAMRGAVEQILQRWGTLDGVIHAAGVVGGQALRTLPATDRAQCEEFFRAKVHGVIALEQALAGLTPDFCLLVSSLAAQLGGLGYLPYAASNLFMDAWSHARADDDEIRWLSLNLDGVQASAGPGQPLAITPPEAIEVFRRALATEQLPQLIVSTADLQARQAGITAGQATEEAETDTAPTRYSRPATQTEYVAPESGLEQMLVDLWQELLGIDQVGVHDDFFELGGNSLLATQAVLRLRELFAVEIPLRTFLEQSTIHNLAAFIAEQQVQQADPDEIARLLEQLEQMSDDEVRAAQQAEHSPAAPLIPLIDIGGSAPVPDLAAAPLEAATSFEKLLEPTRIGRMQLKNRMIMPAMECGFGSTAGHITPQQLDYYAARARGGVGLIVTEATCVDAPTGRLAPTQNLIADDSFIPGLRELVDVVHRNGAQIAIQLFHAGRKTTSFITGTQPVAPSPVPNHWGDTPRELTTAEIAALVRRWADAAERAVRAGFDGIEIHAAHSYLISQFLSPLYNQRTDAYGGSIEHRARFLLEIIGAIRDRVGPDYPLWVRLSAMDYAINGAIRPHQGGITLEETQIVAQLAEAAGVDAIHVSASHIGLVRMHPMDWPPAVMQPLVEGIKAVVDVPVIAVGRIPPELGETMLRTGKADLIALGRALIADPDLPRKIAEGQPDAITPCIYCWTCLETVGQPGGARCPVNASFGVEGVAPLRPAPEPKRVVVVGGGVAGMEAARVAALRGHAVTLFEQSDTLGGQLLRSPAPQIYRETVESYRAYLVRELDRQGVTVRLGERFTPELAAQLTPDAAIIATGATPRRPAIPGAHLPHVQLATDVLAGATTGARVVVIGGEMVGCSTALHLAEQGKHVTIVRRGPQLATHLGPSMSDALITQLVARGVTILTGTACEEITAAGAVVSTRQGRRRTLPADTVVLAAGASPDAELAAALRGIVPQVAVVGNSRAPGDLRSAVADGFGSAREL